LGNLKICPTLTGKHVIKDIKYYRYSGVVIVRRNRMRLGYWAISKWSTNTELIMTTTRSGRPRCTHTSGWQRHDCTLTRANGRCQTKYNKG